MTKSTSPSSYVNVETGIRVPEPNQVRWSLRLLWLSLALSVAQYVSSFSGAIEIMPINEYVRGAMLFGLAVPAASFILDGFLNLKISHGKNWARIFKLVLVLISVVFQLFYIPTTNQSEVVFAVVLTLLNFSAMYLIFTDPGRQWFK